MAHRAAVGQGRLIDFIALDQIDDLALVRDRTVIDPGEMTVRWGRGKFDPAQGESIDWLGPQIVD